MASVAREEVQKALGEMREHVAPEYLSTGEAAAHARVHVSTIRRWIRQGRLTESGAGAHARVLRVELEARMRPDGRRQPARAAKSRQPTPEEMADAVVGQTGVQRKFGVDPSRRRNVTSLA